MARQQDEELENAHKHSSSNYDELMRSKKCGCFFCGAIFQPDVLDKEENFIFADNDCDRGGTATCPNCFIDSVIGDASGFPITEDFLREMHAYWFGGKDFQL